MDDAAVDAALANLPESLSVSMADDTLAVVSSRWSKLFEELIHQVPRYLARHPDQLPSSVFTVLGEGLTALGHFPDRGQRRTAARRRAIATLIQHPLFLDTLTATHVHQTEAQKIVIKALLTSSFKVSFSKEGIMPFVDNMLDVLAKINTHDVRLQLPAVQEIVRRFCIGHPAESETLRSRLVVSDDDPAGCPGFNSLVNNFLAIVANDDVNRQCNTIVAPTGVHTLLQRVQLAKLQYESATAATRILLKGDQPSWTAQVQNDFMYTRNPQLLRTIFEFQENDTPVVVAGRLPPTPSASTCTV
jgi:hypothetical protein